MTADELKAVLQREYVAVPEQERRETEENYQQKLLRVSRLLGVQIQQKFICSWN